MKSALILSALLIGSTMTVAHAEETASEKAGEMGRDAGHSMKKAGNRVKEATCMEGDVKCAGKKMKHRAGEAKDATVNKAKDVKDQVD